MTNMTQPGLDERASLEPVHEDDSTTEVGKTVAEVEKTVARGKSPSTPFLVLGGVSLVVFAAVAVVALAALLVWWLV